MNENIERHAFWIELNSNSMKRNGMQIGGEDIENLLMEIVLEKNFPNNTNLKRHIHFNASLLGNGLNDSSLELFESYLWLMEPKVVLPKLVVINDDH